MKEGQISVSVPSSLSNKLVTTNALWSILTEVTNNIYDNMPDPVDISGKANIDNPTFTGSIKLGTNNIINKNINNVINNNTNSFIAGHQNYINNINSVAVGTYSTAAGEDSFAQGTGSFERISVSSINNKTIVLSSAPSYVHPGNVLNHTYDGYYLITDYDSNSKTITLNRQVSVTNKNNWYIQQGNIAFGKGSHAEGYETQAADDYSHTEGYQTSALEYAAHAEGYLTEASGSFSHAEGRGTQTQEVGSHAEGQTTVAVGEYTHAEGLSTRAADVGSHAEGESTHAAGRASHAEGNNTIARGTYSHAEGINTQVSGEGAHAGGYYTIANGKYSYVFGAYNVGDSLPSWQKNTSYKIGDKVSYLVANALYECIADHTSTNTFDSAYWKSITTMNYIEIAGNGTAANARSNARTLDWAGNEWLAGNLTAAGGTFTLGATALTEVQLQALQALPSTIGNIHSFDVQVVQALPSSDIETHTIYFVPKTGTTNDVYDEYLYINNQWEMIGNTQIDLSNYLTTNDIAAWAKASTKPTYTAAEVGALPSSVAIPNKVSDLMDDSGHYTKPSGGIPASDLAETYATQTYVDNALAAKVVSVEGTTPAITAVADTQYICGEVSTLSFTPSATGISDIIFESGSTATVLTVPNTVKFPEWFDAAALETNMVYEISIMNGTYGAVMAWATT